MRHKIQKLLVLAKHTFRQSGTINLLLNVSSMLELDAPYAGVDHYNLVGGAHKIILLR